MLQSWQFIKVFPVTLSLCVLLLITACVNNIATAEKQSVSNALLPVRHAEKTLAFSADHDVRYFIDYPEGEGVFPLIVFSHGNALDANTYTNLTDFWVSHGYVVVAPYHLDSGGRDVANAVQKDYGSDWVTASRVLELRFAIDNINRLMVDLPGFSGRVSTDKVISAGHSYGALTAQQLGGAILERVGNSKKEIPAALSDSRVAAVVALSPPGVIPGFLSSATWAVLTTPQLVVSGTEDYFKGIWEDYTGHLISYESAMPGENYALVLDGMNHYLNDQIGRTNSADVPATKELKTLQSISMLFIAGYLQNDKDKLARLNNTAVIAQEPGVVVFGRR